MESKFFELKNSDNLNKLKDSLSTQFSNAYEKPVARKRLFFDTFDWRLFQKDLTLCKENDHFFLASLKNKDLIDKNIIKDKERPIFWRDFPDGALKEKLKEYIGIRAVMPVINIESNEKPIKILDQNEKTVVRISFNKNYTKEIGKKNLISNEIEVIPIRGYDEDFDKVVSFFTDFGLKETPKNQLFFILEDKRKKSGNYSGKLNIKLNPQMSSVEAAKVIYLDLLKTVKQNEEGIKSDIDTEFLHDFRVAVRRIRSALTQIKGVFPKKDVNRFKKDFAVLGKNTNKLRDLDVYLLEKEKYKKMLSRDLSSGLEPVFSKLEKQRNTELKKLTKFIETEKYKKIIDNFETFLKQKPANTSEVPSANKEIYDLASGFIWKKYSQIINKGKNIDDSTPDTELHNLRIECKKLRYLLEFFSSLFPQKEMSIIIKQLKKLQDNLGDFNDLYVQQQSLKKILRDFDGGPDEIKKVSASIGGLIITLNQRQIKTRNEFSKSFSELDSTNNSKIFKELFQPKGEE